MAQSVHPDAPTCAHAGGVAALLDRYEVLGVIGQGGMGTVYKGYHLALKRFVAIKILRIDQIRSPALVARFLREMQAVGQMDHPNVVRAADGGEKNGLFYLVMEFLEGRNLSQLAAGRDGLPPADACELVRQAALGLDYIHQKLVHRDVKPSNLLLTPAGVVKILDLGLARLHEADPGDKERTPEGCALGTFDYMAPEQATGSGSVDGRTDIYSLGCTLFKLLTGRPPFSGPEYDSVARKLYAHGRVPLTALTAFQAVPEQVRPVLLRMAAKDPADRYATAGEAARDLAPFAAGSDPARLLAGSGGEPALKPLPVPPPEEFERLTASPHETPVHTGGVLEFQTPAPPPPARRRPLLMGAAALGVVLAAVLIVVWFFLGRGRPNAPTPPTPPGPDQPPVAPGPEADQSDLLARPPVLLRQPKRDFQWTYDPEKREFSFLANGLCLFQLGEAATADYGFEFMVSPNSADDRVGLFFGYRRGPDGKRPDAGRYYAFAVRPSYPLEQREGGVLELSSLLIDFEKGNRVSLASLLLVPIPTPRGAQRVRVQVARGKIVQLAFGSADLGDQLKSLAPLEEPTGGFGLYCDRGSGFVRSAKRLSPAKEP